MKNTVQDRGMISSMHQHATNAALALGVVLVAAIVTTQSAQAQTLQTLYAFTGERMVHIPRVWCKIRRATFTGLHTAVATRVVSADLAAERCSR
jgi:hypothetical protein